MAYVSIAASRTDSESPLEQSLFDDIRLDLDDLNSRTAALEGATAVAIFDHFVYDDQEINAGAPKPAHDRWKSALDSFDADNKAEISLLSTDHVARLRLTYKNVDGTGPFAGDASIEGRIRGVLRLTPPQRPRVVWRCRVSDFTPAEGVIEAFAIGLANDRALRGTISDGIFLEISAGSFRFSTRKNGANTAGSTFTIAADNAWFVAEIKYTDGDTVECYFDGVLKTTFNGPTDNVPDTFGDIMYAEATIQVEKTVNNANIHTLDLDLDRGRQELQSIADAA